MSDELVLVSQSEVDRWREIEEAARDVLTPCDLYGGPRTEDNGLRIWCSAHHEYDRSFAVPCPFAALKTALERDG